MLKVCTKCNCEKELNIENFAQRKKVSKSKRNYGKLYITWHSYCLQCRRKTRIGEYQRNKPTEEQRKWKRGYAQMYGATLKGKAIRLLKAYRSSDKRRGITFMVDQDWFIENILKNSCYYCGSAEQIGADRIDNNIGHIHSNLVPCCAVCNTVRSDIFTVEEMMQIGATIRSLRQNRNISKIAGNKAKTKEYRPYKKPELVNEKVA